MNVPTFGTSTVPWIVDALAHARLNATVFLMATASVVLSGTAPYLRMSSTGTCASVG
jgi:hypothetical protein